MQDVYSIAASFLQTFTEVTNTLYEVNSRKPEIEAMDRLLVDIQGIKSAQDRCIDMLQQDEQVLKKVPMCISF